MPYKYQDLSYTAKEKALSNYVEHYVTYDNYEHTYERWVEKLGELGIDIQIDDIRYSGFWSQGDGASFTGTINLQCFLEAHPAIQEGYPELYLSLIPFSGAPRATYTLSLNRVSHHSLPYVHDKTVGLDWELVDWDTEDMGEGMEYLESLMSSAEEDILYQCREYMQEIYSDLEEDYEYQCSEESFLDTVELNDWLFTETGNLI